MTAAVSQKDGYGAFVLACRYVGDQTAIQARNIMITSRYQIRSSCKWTGKTDIAYRLGYDYDLSRTSTLCRILNFAHCNKVFMVERVSVLPGRHANDCGELIV